MPKKQLNWKPLGVRWQEYTPRRTARGLPVANADGDNCGTGAGGFKRGNTCAGGGNKPPMSGMLRRKNDTVRGLVDDLGLPHAQVDSHDHTVYGALESNVGVAEEARRVVEAARNVGFLPAGATGGGTPENPRTDGSWSVTMEHPEGHHLDIWFTHGGMFHNDRLYYNLEFVPEPNREGYAISREAARASSSAGYSAFFPAEMARIGDNEQAVKYHLQMADMHARYAATRDQPNAKALHRDAEAAHRIAADYHMEKAGLQ